MLSEICVKREYRNGRLFVERYLSFDKNGMVLRECGFLEDLAESLRNVIKYTIKSRTSKEESYKNKSDISIHTFSDGGFGAGVKIRSGLSDKQLEELAKYISLSPPMDEYVNNIISWWAGGIANRT